MRKIALLSVALTLLATATAAHAATYTVKVISTGFVVCQQLTAPDPKTAFQTCMAALGVNVPAWAIVITATQVCKSTHRVTQTAPNLLVKFAYDTRFPRPGC